MGQSAHAKFVGCKCRKELVNRFVTFGEKDCNVTTKVFTDTILTQPEREFGWTEPASRCIFDYVKWTNVRAGSS